MEQQRSQLPLRESQQEQASQPQRQHRFSCCGGESRPELGPECRCSRAPAACSESPNRIPALPRGVSRKANVCHSPVRPMPQRPRTGVLLDSETVPYPGKKMKVRSIGVDWGCFNGRYYQCASQQIPARLGSRLGTPMAGFLTLEEAAERLGVEYKTIYRLVRSGELPRRQDRSYLPHPRVRSGRVFRAAEAAALGANALCGPAPHSKAGSAVCAIRR